MSGLMLMFFGSASQADSLLCQRSDVTDNPSGFGSDDGPNNLVIHAEDVVLVAGDELTRVAWRGFYSNALNTTPCSPSDDFTIRIFVDDGSGSKPNNDQLVYLSAIGGSVETQNTGLEIPYGFDTVDVYRYSATLSPAFVAPASRKYWISIASNTPPNPNQCYWWWLTADRGNDRSSRRVQGLWFFSNNDFDLCVNPDLIADVPTLSLSLGGHQAMSLIAEPGKAGWFYWMFGSATGTAPGVSFGPGVVLPLNFDGYFSFTLNKPFAGIFASFIGFLDVNGEGSAGFTLPAGLDPTLMGVTLYHSYLAASVVGGAEFSSIAESVLLVP